MANKEPGYVYIFTNESFREGWVKIGKTQNINKRLTQLDNTSCPMPFDVYATLKTKRYDEAEEFVHDFISHFNSDLRVRPNREYFKVNPEEALDILYKVMKLMDEPEAEIIVNDEKGKQHLMKLEKKYGRNCKRKNVEPKEEPVVVKPQTAIKDTKHSQVWLICYDKKYFNVEGCFKKYGQIYWVQKGSIKNVQKGDIAYLYSSSPESAIRFKVEIVDTNLPYSSEMDVEDEFVKKGGGNYTNKDQKFFIVRPIAETKSPALNHKVFYSKKLMGKRPSASLLSKEKFKALEEYIEENFE